MGQPVWGTVAGGGRRRSTPLRMPEGSLSGATPAQARRGHDRIVRQVLLTYNSSIQSTDRPRDPQTRPGPAHARTASSLRPLVHRLIEERPAIVWTLALLFLVKGLLGVLAAADPVSASEPVAMVGVAGAMGIACALAIWLIGARLPLLGFGSSPRPERSSPAGWWRKPSLPEA